MKNLLYYPLQKKHYGRYGLNKMTYTTKTYSTRKLFEAYKELKKFRSFSVSPLHERFIFPYICGTYFGYRKVDVLRVAAIAKSISPKPKYLDVGCGYGDFLEKIREFIPDAIGIEKDGGIFYEFNRVKPDHIQIKDVSLDLNEKYDVIFVGWMDPGVDFRKAIANSTDIVVTTLDQGISLGAEFEEFGFRRIAWWRTPSWMDVNYQIMNKYYTKMSNQIYENLFDLRGAHNLWYIYTKNLEYGDTIKNALIHSQQEDQVKYDFEGVIDECGFEHSKNSQFSKKVDKSSLFSLWNIEFG
jgi:SAM-dependent methyltransferase